MPDYIRGNSTICSVMGHDAYVLRPWFLVGFIRYTATAAQKMLNTKISSSIETVDWSLKDLKLMRTRVDLARMLGMEDNDKSQFYTLHLLCF